MHKQGGLPANALHRQLQAGQILLIVILTVIVVSTIGLSLASRSITSLRSSTEEAESQKALAAAEAGIERAIQGSAPIALSGNNPSNNSHYSTSFKQIQSSRFLLNGGSTILDASDKIKEIIPNTVPKDEGTDVWFVKHNSDGSLDYSDYSTTSPNFLNLYWGSLSDGACGSSTAPAAIQAIIITRDNSLLDTDPNKFKSYRYAYDSCSSQRGNNFTPAIPGAVTQDYDDDRKTDITFGNSTPANDLAKDIVPVNKRNIILMRVIPIYKDTAIGIDTCNPAGNNCTSLPSQGYVITSTGTSGQANRKLTVFKGYPQTYLPYLSYGLFVAN